MGMLVTQLYTDYYRAAEASCWDAQMFQHHAVHFWFWDFGRWILRSFAKKVSLLQAATHHDLADSGRSVPSPGPGPRQVTGMAWEAQSMDLRKDTNVYQVLRDTGCWARHVSVWS